MLTRSAHNRNFVRAAAIVLLLCLAISVAGCGSGGARGTAPATTAAVTTAAADQASFSFIVCGDPQNDYEVFDTILAAARSVDFLVVAGDLTGSGTAVEFENFMSKVRASGVKCYFVPGNHDVATMPVQEGYARYIGQPHYSFDFSNTHFLMIDNSTPSLGFYPSEQAWAAADLKAAKSRRPQHVLAVTHVPPRYPYSATASKDQIAGIDANDKLVPVLKAGGAEELFCGHVHSFDEETVDGLRITITGGAGAPLMGLGSYHNYVLVQVNGRNLTQKVVRI